MKSVIAQGATVAKAIEEALKKADMPKEFFVKLLEDAQAGFLGFGSKKAKIALFFKKDFVSDKYDTVLEQSSYEGLFDNPSLNQQLDQQDTRKLGQQVTKQPMSHRSFQRPIQRKQEPAVDKEPYNSKYQSEEEPRAKQPQRPIVQRVLPELGGQPSDSAEQRQLSRRRRRSRYFKPHNNSSYNDQQKTSDISKSYDRKKTEE